jgi:hypothetical protein
MIKKIRDLQIFSRLGPWAIPLISVGSCLPLVFVQWLPFASPPTKLGQNGLSSLNQPWTPQSIPLEPMVARSSVLKAPQPLTESSPPSQKSVAKVYPPSPSASQPKQSDSRQQALRNRTRSFHPRLPSPPQYAAPKLEIRVAVLDGAESSTVGASQPTSILDSQGKPIQSMPANQGFSVQAAGPSLSLGSWQFPPVVWLEPSRGGLIFIGDRWYRGRVLLVSQGDGLLAINYVDLEHYLYSVVGSEMHPNAPLEALKAQAIAARSYALVHMIRPASRWYNLGDTPRWQAYQGMEKEYNTTQQAVDETAGQILSLQGGVVESLYAATDEIVARAHGGVGMSQTGAYQLASEGYDYQQILNRYYPGVSLARLVLHQ